MIINRIDLENFGIFRGKASFDFSISKPEAKIILIGGKNGSGKTTLLHAIKIALYGPLSFGVKTLSDNYYNYIRDHLNIYALNTSDEQDFSIALEIALSQNGIEHIYQILRKWKFKSSQLQEYVTIEKNGESLNAKEASDFDEFLRKYCPPALFNMFFFDGEKIDDMFTNEFLKKELRRSALMLFNLDLFDSLSKDLNTYLAQANVFKSLSDEQQALSNKQSSRDKMNTKKELLETTIFNLNEEMTVIEKEISLLEQEFKTYGGLLADEREAINKQIYDLESQKRDYHDQLREFITNTLPFCMSKNLLKKIMDQLALEDQHAAHQVMLQMLKEAAFTSKLENRIHEFVPSEKVRSNVISEIVTSISEIANTSIDSEPLYGLSWEEKQHLNLIYRDVEAFDKTKITTAYSFISDANSKIQQARSQLTQSIENSELDAILQKINQLHEDAKANALKKQHRQPELESITSELNQLTIEIDKLTTRVDAAQKDENIFILNHRIQNVIQRFVSNQLAINIENLQSFFKKMFDLLIRKDDMVGEILLSSELNSIEIKNKSGLSMSKTNLSAGETQVFILSLVWALINSSKRDLPLVFDSLFGRLDHSHKMNMTTTFLPMLGTQTILLSTDTEIDEKYYDALKPYIAKEYVMNYNLETKTIDIHQGYFYERG